MMTCIFIKRSSLLIPLLTEPIIHVEKVAKFSLGDFTDMLAFQGVQVTEVFGDYELHHYDVRKTPRLIIIGKKK
jgi:hypothetical protein